MKLVYEYLDMVYHFITEKDWDNTIAVVGDEGKGKSTFLLHVVDYWYVKLGGKCTEADVRHVCLEKQEWAADLRDAQKYELTSYDEAGDINSRRTMSKFNTAVMEAYQIIRGDNLFSILVLPSLWDLDTFFRARRLRGFFYVWRRGKVAYWSRERMRRILMLNESRTVKNYFVTHPTFIDYFTKYTGPLLAPYNKKKTEKLSMARKDFYKKVSSFDDTKDYRDELLVKMMKINGVKKTAALTGVSTPHLYTIRQAAQAKGEL